MENETPTPKGSRLPETPFGLTKVYVDYLPRQNEGLQGELERFLNCGNITKMLKKNGKTNGYFTFKKPNSVRLALAKNNVEFKGKRLRIEVPKGIVGGEGQPVKRKEPYKSKHESADPELQVYLSHLAKPVNPEIIKNVVSDTAPSLTDKIQRIKMMTGNRNSCFVTLTSKKDVENFCTALNGYPLLGMELVAIPAQAPGVMKSGGPVVPPSYEAYKEEKLEEEEEEEPVQEEEEEEKPKQKPAPRNTTCNKVLVGILPDTTRTQDIRSVFSHCGRVTHVQLLRNKVTGASTGVAVIKFDRPESASKAVLMNNTTIAIERGTHVTVELDDNKDKQVEQPQDEEPERKETRKAVRNTFVLVEPKLEGAFLAVKKKKVENTTTEKDPNAKRKRSSDESRVRNDSKKRILQKTIKQSNGDADDDDEEIVSDSEAEEMEVQAPKVVVEAKKPLEKKVAKKKKVKVVAAKADDDDSGDEMVEVSATKGKAKKPSGKKEKASTSFEQVDMDLSDDDEEFLRRNPKLAAMRKRFLEKDGAGEKKKRKTVSTKKVAK
eukprot:TRINITY_DN11108_c1_g1_i1.p1 TRINITY_DN11108_c1_g1~~TRINITY_DN11108_c1_g1_i1.p1  ORF type:complete len:565 (+),score=179.16 TRINITY_DN11108_c1_g1_i1:49-1695(+)